VNKTISYGYRVTSAIACVLLMNIGYNATDELVKAVCIMQNIVSVSTVLKFQWPV